MAIVVVVGLGLRLWILHSRLGVVDSDEAVTALMAKRLLHGHTNAFYLGQAYGGTQESVLVALVYSVVRSWTVAMRVVPVALWATACVLVWRIGRRMFGESAGRAGGLLVWVGPAAGLWRSIKEQAFYGFTMVMGLALVLLAVRLVERPSRRDAALAGLVGGLGWWANPQIAYFALPAVVWMLVRRPGLVRFAWLAVCGALVGAAPWLYANVGKGFPSLHSPPQGVPSTYLHRLHLFGDPGLPILLGLRRVWTKQWLVPGLAPVLYIVALVALVAAAVAFGRAYANGRGDDGRGLLFLVCVCYPFVFAISPFSFYVLDGRYLIYLWPVLALLAASALPTRGRQMAAIAVVAGLATAGFGLVLTDRSRDPNHPIALSHSLGPVLRVLDERGVDDVFADYWAAYRIDMVTDERVRATPILGTTRDVALLERVRSSPRPGYVVLAGSPADDSLDASLRSRGTAFERLDAGDYVVYLPDTAVMPESIPGL